MNKREEERRWKDEAAETEKDQEAGCSQPRRKRMSQMKIGETVEEESPRYTEFGEGEGWEMYDWD